MVIDMQNRANVARAVELATAASDPDKWGECKTEWIHALAGDSTHLWCVFVDECAPDGPLVTAVTGNGEKSRANAEFYVSAREIVLGLARENDRLRAALRTPCSQCRGAGTQLRGGRSGGGGYNPVRESACERCNGSGQAPAAPTPQQPSNESGGE